MATSGQNPSDHEIEQGEFNSLLSCLPKEKWWDSPYIYKYKDFWFVSSQLQGVLACEQNSFEAQETDVLLVTVPKSGTIWLKALLFALTNRTHFPVTSLDHPLLLKNPHDLVPFLELIVGSHSSSPRPLPRLCSTHLPAPFLQKSALDSGSKTKIIYLCRNPKDTLVSYWHFVNKLMGSSSVSIDDLFEKFCQGVSLYGPYWDHVLGYWKESVENPDKVLFLSYEKMKENPELSLKHVAEFLNCPFSKEEEECGIVDQIIDLCSFKKMSKMEVNKSGKLLLTKNKILKNEVFFRRGEVEDWKNYLSIEMANRLDHITQDKFNNYGLKF